MVVVVFFFRRMKMRWWRAVAGLFSFVDGMSNQEEEDEAGVSFGRRRPQMRHQVLQRPPVIVSFFILLMDHRILS